MHRFSESWYSFICMGSRFYTTFCWHMVHTFSWLHFLGRNKLHGLRPGFSHTSLTTIGMLTWTVSWSMIWEFRRSQCFKYSSFRLLPGIIETVQQIQINLQKTSASKWYSNVHQFLRSLVILSSVRQPPWVFSLSTETTLHGLNAKMSIKMFQVQFYRACIGCCVARPSWLSS